METVVQASAIGLKSFQKGMWPEKITYKGADYARGKYRYSRDGSRLLNVEYRDMQGRALLVLND